MTDAAPVTWEEVRLVLRRVAAARRTHKQTFSEQRIALVADDSHAIEAACKPKCIATEGETGA